MNNTALPMTRTIEASGPLMFRRADEAVPEGYHPFGPVWAMAVPVDLLPAGLSERPTGQAFVMPTAVPALRNRLQAFWEAETDALLPKTPPHWPLSVAGISSGTALLQPVTIEAARGDQIAAHAARRAAQRHLAPGVPSFADLILRQIAVLHLPSAAEAVLDRTTGGDWVLEFREIGSMGHLLDDLFWDKPDKRAKRAHLECRPTATAPEASGVLTALARAVQLAHLAVACGLDPQSRLRVEVSHTGLGARALTLTLQPQDRGLPFARLAHQLAGSLKKHGGFKEELHGLPCNPKLEEIYKTPTATTKKRPPDTAEPLRWNPQGGEADLHWVYSGDRATSERYPSGLPFALAPYDPVVWVPQDRARTFRDLSLHERGAYVEWLMGPRRTEGFSSVFADLYFQGLEHHILADAPSTQELEALVKEVRHIRVLIGPEDRLAAQIASLLDWLAATGRCATGPLSAEGPLTCLAILGRAVAQGRPLDPSDLSVMLRVSGWADKRPGTDSADWSGAVFVSPPAKPLVARYLSRSGLCDVGRLVFQHGGVVIPDLRASARLRMLLMPDAERTEEQS